MLVGDIMTVEIGDVVGVDGILINTNEIYVDESIITGEKKLKVKTRISDNLKESKINPFLMSGSEVLQGSGEMIVCCIGKNTLFGKYRQ